MIKIFGALKAMKELGACKLQKFHLVSIRDNATSVVYTAIDAVSKECLGMHAVLMHDLQAGEPLRDGEVLPTRDHIEPILEFAKGKDNMAVHCTGGISRSSAVAFLIECQRTRSADEAAAILDPKIHFPNRTIIVIGEKILGMELMPAIDKFNDMAAKVMFEKDNG